MAPDFWKDLVRMARERLANPESPDQAEALDAARSVVAEIPPGPPGKVGVDGRGREDMAREIARRLLEHDP
ncbi:MAG TPA: hypothetical protein VFA17_02735 [Thermoplasmata archaeon]|jgi:hypothetical protein|nr:hypothetical protein [Thermoplasmata archaeon]